ncbi:hypothetical protein GCM10010267_09750 [Streptomyces griseorubens]|nr:hypothetical protein GCM10010267_09750 [Streptomyces griseorubens]
MLVNALDEDPAGRGLPREQVHDLRGEVAQRQRVRVHLLLAGRGDGPRHQLDDIGRGPGELRVRWASASTERESDKATRAGGHVSAGAEAAAS